MKPFTLTFLLIIFVTTFNLAQNVTLPPSGDNQKSVVTQYIGSLAHVTITYNSPDVSAPNGQSRKGQIWGQLVPYGLTDLGFGLGNPSPWRAGANENTVIEFSHDMLVEGKPIEAGKYGLHVIVEETGPWTIILSNNSTAWGSYFYKEEEDALRVQATPQDSEYHEWLTYEFTDRQPHQTTVALLWENKKLPFTISIPDVPQLYVDNMRKELENTAGFNWQGWMNAANYCVQNDVNLEEALTWAENAVSLPFIGNENFNTLQTKGLVLMKLNRTDEAIATMEKAIKHPTANSLQIHSFGRQLIGMDMKEKAMEVFEYNFERYDGAWPTHVGMMRGLSALGKHQEALKHAKLALEQAPDQLNRDNLKQLIQNLEKGEGVN
jgi:hypothetical protein